MTSTAQLDPLTGLPKGTKNTYNFGALYNQTAANHPGLDFTNVLPGLPPSQVNYGGFMPDYKSLIENDAGFKAALDALNPAGIANAAQRDAGIQRGYIQAGFPLDLDKASSTLGLSLGDLQNIINPTTQQLATENTQAGLSTQARLDQAHMDAIRNIKNALAARGALHSGEAGFQLGRENQNYSQGEYDAQSKLLDYISSYQQGFAQAEQQRQAQIAQAASQAADRQVQLPQNQPTEGQTAVLDGYAPDGTPLYRAPDGTLHRPDGSVYTAAPPAPTPTSAPLPDFTRQSPIVTGRGLHGGGPNARFE